MAYGNSKFGKPAVAAAPVRGNSNSGGNSGGTKREYILSTGLFAPTREGVKAIGSVQLKEDVVIPAGSYVNIYENEKRDKATSPAFRLTVTAGKLKQQQ